MCIINTGIIKSFCSFRWSGLIFHMQLGLTNFSHFEILVLPGPGAIKIRRAQFLSQSHFYKRNIYWKSEIEMTNELVLLLQSHGLDRALLIRSRGSQALLVTASKLLILLVDNTVPTLLCALFTQMKIDLTTTY